jgi:hypothetical protein
VREQFFDFMEREHGVHYSRPVSDAYMETHVPWLTWQAAYRAGMESERERCAKICATLAEMMESGAGALEPGGRLRQAESAIRAQNRGAMSELENEPPPTVGQR